MKNILIVEDEPDIRSNLKELLELENYWVWEASSGGEGLKLFRQQPIDLIISDILMPEMDGFEFCRQVRNAPTGKLIPFLFLSAKADFSDIKMGYNYGADEYLVKPCSLEELTLKISALLERTERIHRQITDLLQKTTVPGTESAPTQDNSSQPQSLSVSQTSKSFSGLKKLILTTAEERVFFEVLQGYTNKEIGEHLFISDRTVQAHLRNILRKINLKNRSQLVRFALENGYQPQQELKTLK